ncbi:DUF1573 domain-containing protein [Flavobacterium sp. LaA7.5]|nr:DUF1573 domain-containing protein [Flavobacterium salilacus subsp. altitudinum]
MKSLKFTLFAVAGALLLSFSANAQSALKPAVKGAKATTATSEEKNMQPSGITWEEDTHNFGEIEQGKPVSHEFTFKNTTKQTILITNVKASCGCTATNYTKTPIKPGETGSVTATYNARSGGNFNKTVSVTTNDSDVKKVLKIKGKVLTPEVEEAAPGSKQ